MLLNLKRWLLYSQLYTSKVLTGISVEVMWEASTIYNNSPIECILWSMSSDWGIRESHSNNCFTGKYGSQAHLILMKMRGSKLRPTTCKTNKMKIALCCRESLSQCAPAGWRLTTHSVEQMFRFVVSLRVWAFMQSLCWAVNVSMIKNWICVVGYRCVLCTAE